jgi:hypothetical protein
MFRYRSLVLLVLATFLWSACQTSSPPGPTPSVVVQQASGYRLTLLDDKGQVTAVHNIRREDLLEEDVLHQNLRFRDEAGQTVRYHGSWKKEVYRGMSDANARSPSYGSPSATGRAPASAPPAIVR